MTDTAQLYAHTPKDQRKKRDTHRPDIHSDTGTELPISCHSFPITIRSGAT
jgi:hypothetical protein